MVVLLQLMAVCISLLQTKLHKLNQIYILYKSWPFLILWKEKKGVFVANNGEKEILETLVTWR